VTRNRGHSASVDIEPRRSRFHPGAESAILLISSIVGRVPRTCLDQGSAPAESAALADDRTRVVARTNGTSGSAGDRGVRSHEPGDFCGRFPGCAPRESLGEGVVNGSEKYSSPADSVQRIRDRYSSRPAVDSAAQAILTATVRVVAMPMGSDKLVDVWIMAAFEVDVVDMLLGAVSKACDVRAPRSVTTEHVAAQLPSPYPEYWPDPEAVWDLRSVAQRLRGLADRGLILRVGMRPEAPGTPAVQHWWAPPVSAREGYGNSLRLPMEQFADKSEEDRAQIFGGTALRIFPIRS